MNYCARHTHNNMLYKESCSVPLKNIQVYMANAATGILQRLTCKKYVTCNGKWTSAVHAHDSKLLLSTTHQALAGEG
eukprot:CAMPEP_0172723804 /NCGR_PEP_ID=MMETSP1074-20121228/84529_1 /TAXON_ID=2916 /ORGANISM="Ceratium fusus, Strain PA161109" /LENGTH=76 /DNA_ID=CAMNT_0013550107 /DNA_START=28 /DNA_END=255 /DNA_ORIENTATION=+